MKKQYLISLLGLTAIFISAGSGFSSSIFSENNVSSNENSSQTNSNLSEEELNTIEQYSTSDEYFDWTIEQIEMGNESSIAVVNDGTGPEGDHLYAWGDNEYGQLGIPLTGRTIDQYDSPQEVTELPSGDIEQIAMGNKFTGAIVDGDLYTWGINDYGQLGYEPAGISFDWTPEYQDTPKLVPDVDHDIGLEFNNGNVEQISMGQDFSIAVVNDENSGKDYLYTWGSNASGQLGQNAEGFDGYYHFPYQVTDIPKGDIEQISAGSNFGSAVITNDNGTDELYTWGSNYYGKLGIYEEVEDVRYDSPQKVEDLPTGDITSISLGTEHGSLVLDNEIYTWGNNLENQLGFNNEIPENDYKGVPTKIEDFPSGNINDISMKGNASSAIVDNKLYTWGEASEYQLGIEETETTTDKYTPQYIPIPPEDDPEKVSMISLGINHGAAVANNELYTWGNNNKGQLGLSSGSEGFFIPEYVENDMPYLTNVWSEPQTTNAGDRTIEIKYGFKTNIIDTDEEFSVDTHVVGKNSTIESTSTPISENKNSYTGSDFISTTDENPYGDFTYKMDLNYIDRKGNPSTQELVSDGEFNLTPKIQSPKFEPVDEVEVISSTEASVGYELIPAATDSAGNLLTLKEVSWINLDEPEGEQILDTKITSELTGELKSDKFEPTETYKNTKLVAKYEDSAGNPVSTTTDVPSFTMFFESTPTTVTSGKPYSISKNGASVNYTIDLGLGSDGEEVKIQEVRWMYGDQELDVSNKSGPTGTLTTTDLDPNHNYYNTRIEVDVSGENVCPVDSARVPPFKTDPGNEPTIVQESGTVEVLSSTSATVYYNIDLGLDKDGEPVEVTKVAWLNEGVELVSTTSSAKSGELTYNNFDYNQEYRNTTIEVEVSDHSTVKPATVEGFTTNPAICVWPTVETSNFSKDQTTASIDYKIYQGSNEWAKSYEITSIQWVEADGITPFYNSEPVDNPNNNPNGTLNISGLTPGSPYPESKILVTFEGTPKIETTVDEFSTTPAGIVEPTVTNEGVTTINQTEASVTYEIDQGNDGTAEEYKIESIEWVEFDTEVPFQNSKPVNKPNQHPNGKLNISELSAGTWYPKSEILVKFEGTSEKRSEVEAFQTPKYNEKDPSIKSEIVDEQLTSTSATFNYEAEPGSDANNEPYNLTKIEIMDKNDTPLATEGNGEDPMDLTGEITIEDKLEPGVKYEDLIMVATFIDSKSFANEEIKTDSIDPFTTPSDSDSGLFGIYMIVGIAVGAAVFVVILFGGLGYLWNKKVMKIK